MRTLCVKFFVFTLLIMVGVCPALSAQPVVILKVFPPVQTLGPDTKLPIIITARIKPEKASITWEYTGPGTFTQGDQETVLFYVPPDVAAEESMPVIITVTVSDEQGQQASDSVTLTLLRRSTSQPTGTPTLEPGVTPTSEVRAVPTSIPTVPPLPEPTVTATPVPTATSSPTPFMTPTPQPTATFTPQPAATVTPRATVTPTPRPIATPPTIPTISPSPKPTATPAATATVAPTPESTATLAPKPTLTPTLTVTPTISPFSELFEELARINQKLAQDDAQYQTLKNLELQGRSVTDQLIPVLNDIMQDLAKVARIYRQLPQSTDILKKLEVVNAKQQMFEKERFETLKRQFVTRYDVYTTLTQQEQKGINVDQQIIPVLKDLLESLAAIQALDKQLLFEFPDALEELRQLREIEDTFKKDLAVRQKISSANEEFLDYSSEIVHVSI